jgi:hypothetical protein
MRFSRCLRRVGRAAAVGVALSVVAAPLAMAATRPKPGKFRLFASAEQFFRVNRVDCRVLNTGELCRAPSTTVPGGFWPKGSPDAYIFAGGLQIGGIVDNSLPATQNVFAGDTAGGFFYNTSGTSNGLALTPIFAANDPADAAAWPVEARVPCSDPASTEIPGGLTPESIARCTENGVGVDATGDLFDPALQGTISASQGDHWFMSWEGDPSNLAGGRSHPLGIAVETRMLGWNFPAGNEDIIYFLFTFYNVTSGRDEDYAGVRESLRPLVQQAGRDFVARNTARFGALPEEGYTIRDIFVDVVNDMDVANFNINYAAVNIPFSLGYTYENAFTQAADFGWTFDPSIFGSAPFFPGVGFVGVKYLQSPQNPETGEDVGLTLFGTFSNTAGSLTDPNDDKQLYRYMTGRLLPTDGACTLPNPFEARICSVNLETPTDMRFYQASGPFNLAPGQFGTIVAAYIFAAPVADGNCPGPACDVKPADGGQASRLTILGDPARMAGGVNQIDRMTGYLDFNDENGDGVVTQEEFVVQPGSLLGKSLIAQSVFDSRFLLPFAPAAPEFFVVPGNEQVTVLWTPSATESPSNPDPFFAVAGNPLNSDGTVNPLYDPNFRPSDVEGYRIYRGRTDNPSQLTMLAQFDYGPDPATGRGIFRDFRGTVNPQPGCAPELGVFTTCDTTAAGTPILQPPPPPGTPFTAFVEEDLTGTVTQVIPGNRVLLADSTAQILPGLADTAFADIAAGRLATGLTTELANTGVPFVFVDEGVQNSVRYFYAVTAFDVNSRASGPSSLESARTTLAVTPTAAASNVANATETSFGIFGRDVELPAGGGLPTLDPATGMFSGPFPPANGAVVELAALVPEIVGDEGAAVARLDSITLGSAYQLIAHQYWFTGGPPGLAPELSTVFAVPILQPEETGVTEFAVQFKSQPVDPNRAAPYGGNASFVLPGQVEFGLPGPDYLSLYGRGCVNARPGFGDAGACAYNGSRWFAGPSPANNETQEDPIACNTGNFSAVPMTCYNNAGVAPGAATIYQTQCYQAAGGAGCREHTGITSGAKRAADFNLYWGAAGVIDSVIDVTHNVPVPLSTSRVSSTWGVLNSAAQTGTSPDGSATLTNFDFACVEPFRSYAAGAFLCPAATPAYALSNTVTPGPVGFFSGGAYPPTVPIVPAANAGFGLYIAGDMFTFELAGGAVPAAGTVWSLRQYTGAILGGQGAGGDLGPYQYSNPEEVLPFTAIGAELRSSFTVDHGVAAATENDLSRVHTVPDPYYVRSAFEVAPEQKILKFVGLPQRAIVRIYSASGVLVRLLEHNAANYSATNLSQGSEMQWDLRNRNNQTVASGVYFFHIEAGDARRVGRFTVVNFAE